VAFADPGPADLAAVQAQLRPGEAFLSFVIGARRSYALVVTANTLSSRTIEIDTETLASYVADLRAAFVPRFGGLEPFPVSLSYTLYQSLFGPLEQDLQGINHLIVAPNGDLSSLPLALLITANPGQGPTPVYAQTAWLVRRMALSQVPSARAFLSLRTAQAQRVAAAQPFLGIGNPLFAGTATPAAGNASPLGSLTQQCREGAPVAPELLRSLPALADTEDELRTVANQLGGDVQSLLLAANASEPSLRARPLGDYRVLYFATHGLLPGELRCQSEPALVLSPPDGQADGPEADGLLDASEIAALSLNADLVVLSACNTALDGGNRFGGGALEGLATSFFNAGARAILATHWEIPSEPTVKLMTGLFERLNTTGMGDLAESLRQSQLALIGDPATGHPYNWAAFTLIGSSATLSQSR
jgi:CHAT domain-containing protein